ncbi:MAG: T9SS type A sorting domain-containing protein [Candidatus Tenebribacter davisii]|jgi:hypothetical protein|nr:T9SS type A sorting domain-containing protein [Candidatus Tenebribacter davisii]
MKKLIYFFFVFVAFKLNAVSPYSYFYAFGENSEILLNWNYTGDEPDLLGCNLFRSEDYISFNQINDDLITSNNETFTYLDEEEIIDTTIYYYKINYIFPDSLINSLAIGALKDIAFEIYSEDTVQITCIPRQTGEYEFRLYQDSCVMYIYSFEDSIEIYQQPENQINYEYRYEFIKIPEFTFSSFFLTEQFLYPIINPTETQDNEIITNSSILYQNHPNPFNPSTTIEFSIQNDSKVDISIFNIKGQKIKNLSSNEFVAGSHSIIWIGDNDNNNPVSSGIYYYKLNVNGRSGAVKKCILMK